MDTTYDQLARRAVDLLEASNRYRVIVLVIGSPGSGKSTLSDKVVERINKEYKKHRHASSLESDSGTMDGIACGSDGDSYDQHTNKGKLNLKSSEFLVRDVLIKQLGRFTKFDPEDVISVEDENFPPRLQTEGDRRVIHGRGTTIEIDSSLSPESHESSEEPEPELAQVIPMDGFHLPVATLKKFEDPEFAILRRGSPFTFDSTMVVTLIELLTDTCIDISDIQDGGQGDNQTRCESGDVRLNKGKPRDHKLGKYDILPGKATGIPDIYIPDFDHALKDPTLNGIKIASTTRILIVEGLYLLLKQEPWCRIQTCLSSTKAPNESWKLEIDRQRASTRVARRHVSSGICQDLESGLERYELNDGINRNLVDEHSYPCDLQICSIDQPYGESNGFCK
ncbi:unnamed protein product [Kuraishia capsulata CBS 1993]|uniref:Phosphoribulokinase/uridine kinase domain-containing protein n=1 Tax=Kuraishia capsulata CBS 1993 TaxID=1382522 RepID=W6MJ12_9ASCO|nr:uncharacterized protein KUCA_T00001909001 [Kuraishia capsulata CBS 1993]CDK25938.1 unnamed protein product [Kuraishia capsulata CBS 1993]